MLKNNMDVEFDSSIDYQECNDQQNEYNDQQQQQEQQNEHTDQQYSFHAQQHGGIIFYSNGPDYLSNALDWSLQNPVTSTEIETEKESTREKVNKQITPKEKKKRSQNPEEWRCAIKKKSRNSGQDYEMGVKCIKWRPRRCVKAPCSEKCRLKCFSKFTQEQRTDIFTSYWSLASIEKQRQFIFKAMDVNVPRYRYVRQGGTRPPRDYNLQYFFNIDGEPIKVCKTFFMNTLDINSRIILTVLQKSNKLTKDVLEEDKRGKHGKQPRVKAEILDGIKAYMETIPTVPSYCVANTKMRYVDAYKTIVDIYKAYVNRCQENNQEFGKYSLFYRIFHSEYNLSIMVSKQEQCALCYNYETADEEQKMEMRKKYTQHILANEFAKLTKSYDALSNSNMNIDSIEIVKKNSITPNSSQKNDKKRICKPDEWQRNLKQNYRNSGKEYEMGTKDRKTRPGRSIKDPCSEKCRLKCFSKFTQDQRLNNFNFYWSLGNIDKQRQFLLNSMLVNKPRYRYAKGSSTRPPREYNLHYFLINNEEPIQVCKLFFMNTLDINARNIRTVFDKSNKLTELQVERDMRGKHGNQFKSNPEVREGILAFIKYIAGNSKLHSDNITSVKQLHRDYVERCVELNYELGSYALFNRIYNAEVKRHKTIETNHVEVTNTEDTTVEREKGILNNLGYKLKLLRAKKLANEKKEAKKVKAKASIKKNTSPKAKKPKKIINKGGVKEGKADSKTAKKLSNDKKEAKKVKAKTSIKINTSPKAKKPKEFINKRDVKKEEADSKTAIVKETPTVQNEYIGLDENCNSLRRTRRGKAVKPQEEEINDPQTIEINDLLRNEINDPLSMEGEEVESVLETHPPLTE